MLGSDGMAGMLTLTPLGILLCIAETAVDRFETLGAMDAIWPTAVVIPAIGGPADESRIALKAFCTLVANVAIDDMERPPRADSALSGAT